VTFDRVPPVLLLGFALQCLTGQSYRGHHLLSVWCCNMQMMMQFFLSSASIENCDDMLVVQLVNLAYNTSRTFHNDRFHSFFAITQHHRLGWPEPYIYGVMYFWQGSYQIYGRIRSL